MNIIQMVFVPILIKEFYVIFVLKDMLRQVIFNFLSKDKLADGKTCSNCQEDGGSYARFILFLVSQWIFLIFVLRFLSLKRVFFI